MKIVKPAIAGTMESSDIIVSVESNEGKGVKIELKSVVENQFGNQIRKVIMDTLDEMGVEDVVIRANDKGALDCTVKARVLTALHRATENTDYKWEVK